MEASFGLWAIFCFGFLVEGIIHAYNSLFCILGQKASHINFYLVVKHTIDQKL